MKERTDGRVLIQVFPNSQLGNAGEMVDGIKSGAISMGHHEFASLAKIVPNVAVFNTPFVYRDAEHSLRATDEKTSPALKELNEELVKKGNIRIVGSFFAGTRHLTSNEKVLSSKDMQGKKYRGVPIKLWSSMLTGMGAVATPVEVSELATALATGLVVGQENPLCNLYSLKLYRGAEVRDDDRPHAVDPGGVRQRARLECDTRGRPQDHGATRWPRSARRRLQWDRDTTDKCRSDLAGQGHDLRREEGWAGHRRVPHVGPGAGRQGLPEWPPYIEKIRAVK